MDGIVNRVSVAAVLLALLGVAACGGDEDTPALPSWAKVSPEQIAFIVSHLNSDDNDESVVLTAVVVLLATLPKLSRVGVAVSG